MILSGSHRMFFAFSLSLYLYFSFTFAARSAGENNESKLNKGGRHPHAGISVWTCVWACECESVCSHSHFMYQTDDACAFDSNCKSIVPFRSAGEFVNELRYDIFPFCIHFSFHIPADTIIFTRHHYRLLVVPNRLTISISSHIHTHTRTYTPKKERERVRKQDAHLDC